jgi:glycosyltransferase involved in cell wall biosynthesis
MPFFSVIVPTYNRIIELNYCLQSLANQTFKDFEVIVVDDGSNEDVFTVIKKWQSLLSIRYIRLEEPSGSPVLPRNRGVASATGQWVCFLDSDDWWYSEKLSSIYNYTGEYDFIYHPMDKYLIKHRVGKMNIRHFRSPIYQDLMVYHNGIVTSGVSVRKEIFKKTGGFQSYSPAEDYELWLRISILTEKFFAVDKCLGGYLNSESGISKNHSKLNLALNEILLKNLNILPVDLQQSARAMCSYIQARNCHLSKDWMVARLKYFSAIRHHAIKVKLKAMVGIILCTFKVVI